MKKVLLVGCGAEIGSILVGMVDPARDGFEISAVLTNPLSADAKHPDLRPIDSLIARVVLAQPNLFDRVHAEGNNLIIGGHTLPIFYGNINDYDLDSLPGPFDVCIVATSKKHIGNKTLMERFASISTFVVGVAEATTLPALYPGLIGTPERFLPVKPKPIKDERVFALGSCQTNGWQAQLRGLLEMAEDVGMETLDMRALEVDIIHPDTPTGRLGTKSISAREQDPRNNLRPSFSQVELSMDRMFPASNNVNTISLRTLIMPPGYQISRFFFTYELEDKSRLDAGRIVEGFKELAKRLPTILHVAEIPLGSRGFEFCEAAAVVLPQPALMCFNDDPFSLAAETKVPVSELIVQAYVHNTRGYCRSVIESVRSLLTNGKLKIYEASEKQ